MRALPGTLLLDALLFWISRVVQGRCSPLVGRRSSSGREYDNVLYLCRDSSINRSVAGSFPQWTMTFFVKNTFAEV
jgi:hypothetical protein